HHLALHSFPTRRSSDLSVTQIVQSGQTLQILSVVCDQLKQLFSSQAGNLDIMGGLSPQSKTAHQDAMLNQNSSQSIADMQDATVDRKSTRLNSSHVAIS